MRTLLHKLLRNKTKWCFQKADLTETTEELKNPARGWYEIYSFQVEEKPDFQSLAWCVNSGDTIALVLLDIGAYREKNLDNKALDNIRDIFRFFGDNGFDIVLRVVYDRQGKALEKEPFFFEQVKTHLQQMMAVVKAFEPKIFVFQGMLIGSWGEMHTSRFLASTKLKELWHIMKEEAGDMVYFAVRKPAQWRLLHPESCGRIQPEFDQMGLFDDAVFGSETHLGTFGEKTRETAGWDNPWSREDELKFEEILCKRVPNGGEAICGELYPETGTVTGTVATLREMHITYLNRAYDENILRLWKQWNWEENDVWQNNSVYDYIGKHLGYRFVVRDVEVTPVKEYSKNVVVTIRVENVGFANFYQEAEVLLEWKDVNGRLRAKNVESDIRAWESGTIQTISCEIERVNCKLYLSAKRKTDGRRICFANKTGRGGWVLLGRIMDA